LGLGAAGLVMSRLDVSIFLSGDVINVIRFPIRKANAAPLAQLSCCELTESNIAFI
jgi:hypothetical protein